MSEYEGNWDGFCQLFPPVWFQEGGRYRDIPACQGQGEDGRQVGQGKEQLIGQVETDVLQAKLEGFYAAEDERTRQDADRFPVGEDDQGDADPAAPVDDLVCD